MRDLGSTTLAALPEPRSVEGIAAIALAVDREAERRYSAFARDLRTFGSPKLATLLEELGDEHGIRTDRLEAEMTIGDRQEFALKDLASLLPQLFSEDATAACDLFGLTPYRVFTFAVSLAQQSFKLYSYLAAAADPRMRDYAERLAGEELSRAAHLRVARRRAYRAERGQPKLETYPVASLVESQADLLAAALAIETRLALGLGMAGEKETGLASTCEATHQRVEELRRASEQAGEPGGPMVEELAKFAHSAKGDERADQYRGTPTRRLLADCERAFTFYDAVASAPVNEAVMLQAQDLSQAALERIGKVRAAADGRDGSVTNPAIG